MAKLTVEQHLLLCNKKHNNKYTYPDWPDIVNNTMKLPICCSIHGIFFQRLSDHKAGCGCTLCGVESKKLKLQKNKEHFIKLCILKHGNKYDYSLIRSDVSRHDKVDIICPIHGKFTQRLNSHINGSQCRLCSTKAGAESNRRGAHYFKQACNKTHNNKYDYSLWPVDVKSSDLVDIVCDKHGPFKQRLNSHMCGRGCTVCGIEQSYTTHKEKYGCIHPHHRHISSETLDKLNNQEWLRQQHIVDKKPLAAIANALGISPSTVGNRFKKFDIPIQYFFSSAAEKEVADFIESLGVKIETNNRTILEGRELDIFIPSHNIAIEYNGLYWHSSMTGKQRDYHLTKTQLCESKGIRLIHLFEDEWRDMNQKCKATLQHFIGKSEKGEYARHTDVKEISWKLARDFLNHHHLLNAGHCGSYRIGAFDKANNLIGVMVFGHQNNENSDKDSIELRRFVTNKKNNPGLGSKMFKYAIKHQQYNKIVAFVDRRWFTGLVKDHIGFTKVSETQPALWWTDGTNRWHRRVETKDTMIRKYNLDSQLTKPQMMEIIGLYQVWDCGKLKLKWTDED